MEEELIQHLLACAPLNALVGQRMNWNKRPQGGVIPDIVLQKISDIPQYAFNEPQELWSSRVQIDCWGNTFLEAVNVSREVFSCLSGLKEELSGVEIQGAFLIGERQSFEEGEATARYHRVSQDFNIWYRKASS